MYYVWINLLWGWSGGGRCTPRWAMSGRVGTVMPPRMVWRACTVCRKWSRWMSCAATADDESSALLESLLLPPPAAALLVVF
jgi:hypothetical protein